MAAEVEHYIYEVAYWRRRALTAEADADRLAAHLLPQYHDAGDALVSHTEAVQARDDG